MTATGTSTSAPHGPFWPLAILAGTMIVFLGWQVLHAAKVQATLGQTLQQQDLLAAQAAQTEAQLQAMLMELLTIAAEGDAAAQVVVTKYNIKHTPGPETPSAFPAALQLTPPPEGTNVPQDALTE